MLRYCINNYVLSCAVQLDKQYHLSKRSQDHFLTHHKSWSYRIIIVRNSEKRILHEFMISFIIIINSYHILYNFYDLPERFTIINAVSPY